MAGPDCRLRAVVAQRQLGPASQALGAVGNLAEDAQADAAHEAGVDDVSVAEARGAEVDQVGARRDQQIRHAGAGAQLGGFGRAGLGANAGFAPALLRVGGARARGRRRAAGEPEHEVAQQPARVGRADEGAARDEARLLQEGGAAVQGQGVDSDPGVGGREHGVHGGDVLGGAAVADRDDEDARVQAHEAPGGAGGGGGAAGAALGRLVGLERERRLVDVRERERESPGYLGRGRREVRGRRGLDEGAERVQEGMFDLRELGKLAGRGMGRRRRGGPVLGGRRLAPGRRGGIGHLDVVGGDGGRFRRRRRVKPNGPAVVGGDQSDLVGIAEGEVGIDKDEDVGYELGEREDFREGGPGPRVGVDDDGTERRELIGVVEIVVLRGIHRI